MSENILKTFMAADSAKTSRNNASWLFSFGASNVKAKATRRGEMIFSFDADDCSEITSFTDRPNRLTAEIKMKRFVRDFDEMFGDDKPNASLAYWDANNNFKNHVYEIQGIKKRNHRYIINTDLNGEYYDKVINTSNSKGLENVEILDPSLINQASFFVDSFWTSLGCWFNTSY